MAHGTPDWGQTAGTVTTYQLGDMAELAARLGSIVTFDRRGDVIFLDAFEDGLVHWTPQTSGTGALAELSGLYARYGNFSAHLKAGSDASEYSRLQHAMAFPVLSKIGLEVGFALASTTDNILLIVEWWDGSQNAWFEVRWRDTDNDLQILDDSNTWVTIATGLDLKQGTTLFHQLKLVADLATGKYTRVILNDVEYDVTAYSAYSAADASAARLNIYVGNYGRNGQNDEAYIDDVIVTHNEPA